MKVIETLEEASAIFKQRNRLYGSGYKQSGKILKAFFPDGLSLKTEEDFTRASNLLIIIGKLSRYCINYSTGGHEDSAIDSIVYWAIQIELDAKGEVDGKGEKATS